MMSIRNLLTLVVVGVLLVFACSNSTTSSASGDTTMKNEIDTVSYAWGANMGSFLKSQNLESLNYAVFEKALKDAMNGGEVLFDETQVRKILQDYGQKAAKRAAAGNKAKSKAFLEENGAKDGVVTLPSGLQYKVTKEGTGPVAQKGDKIKAHYHGTLIDGTVFDSSVDRGQPFEFDLGMGRVIKGWDEAFALMPVGSKWTLYIPSNLAYGDQQQRQGSPIGPGMALIFEVELLEILPQPAQKAKSPVGQTSPARK